MALLYGIIPAHMNVNRPLEMVAPARRTNWIAFMRPDRWSASLWINQSIKIYYRDQNLWE